MFPEDPVGNRPVGDISDSAPPEAGPPRHDSGGDRPPGSPEQPSHPEHAVSRDKPNSPMWLHPSSLVFDLISHFRQLLIPAAIALFSAAQGSWGGMLFAVVLFVPAVLFSVFRYFTLRYLVTDGEMVIKQGLIFRRLRTIPVNRIQNIDLVQNPLHRLLGVAEVRVETASGQEAEATLRVLSMRQVSLLREELFPERYDETAATPSGPPDTEFEAPAGAVSVGTGHIAEPLLEIPTGLLVRAGLASNRGMLLIGIAVGLVYQNELYSRLDMDRLLRFLPALDGSIVNTLMLCGMVVAVLLVLRLLGVVWYILRFFGYRLTRHGEDLRVSCGLFTKVSATIPRKRIQFISIHRTLLMRWMNLAAIRIETAGGGGGQAENASATVSRRWFVPVIPERHVDRLLHELRPGLEWNEARLDWQPLAGNARRRLVRLAGVQSLLVAALGWAVTRPWGWLAGVLAAPALIAWAAKKSRAMRYCRSGEKIIYRSGVLNRKTSITFFDKVQTTRVDQSPFDRRWRQARLMIDTAAAGPAEHRIIVRYLDSAFAASEYQSIAQMAATRTPDFG